ncbi:MAG: hypothetical protein WA421_15680 [Nitrososphaeraceae archaeon]
MLYNNASIYNIFYHHSFLASKHNGDSKYFTTQPRDKAALLFDAEIEPSG